MLLRVIAVLVASIILCGAAPAQSSGSKSGEAREVRIYDVSDLPTDADLDAFAAFMPIQMEPLTPTLMVVAATAEQHDQFRAVLGQLRGLAPASVVVSAALHKVKDASGLRVGQPAGEAVLKSPIVRRIERSGMRRTALELISTESTSFIEDVTPVVGNNAAGFDPTIGKASSGLALSVRVGDGAEGRSSVTVSGWFTRTTLDGQATPLLEASSIVAGVDAMDRTTTTARSLGGDLTLSAGQPTIAAIVDDPDEPGAALVLTLMVAPAP